MESIAQGADTTYRDALIDFKRQLDSIYEDFERRTREQPAPCGSRALAYATACGLKPRMSYTVSETAAYSGIDYQVLNREHREGRLAYVMPAGQTKGARITVEEMDRWMRENER